MKAIWTLLVLSALFVPAFVVAQELEAIPEEHVRKMAPSLIEQAGKFEYKIKIDADVEKANGFHLPKKLGALIVPQKDLKESEELAAKFQNEPGASIGYLFLFHLVPIVDGKRADASRLKTVTVADKDGGQHTIHVATLAVRQLSGDDYRLHVYGTDAKPLIDAKFAEGIGPGPVPVAVELKNPNEAKKEGTVVVTVFGKYQATFQAGYEE
jgi:hypothetical protein